MSIDLSELTLVDLKKLAAKVDKAIAAAEAKQRREARQAVEKISKEYGVPLNELVADDAAKAPRKLTKKTKKPAAVAKFRDPADPSKTWSGKGRRPQWYLAAIEAGASEDDLAI